MKAVKTITEQLYNWTVAEKEVFDKILYGEIRFIIENGIIKRREIQDKKNKDDLVVKGLLKE